MFEPVLGGENDEGIREFVGGFADGDLAFGHGFEEGALDFCGGAVDFVGEDEVGEEGALFGGKLAGAWVVDEGSDEIGWEKVRGELDALKLGMNAGGECFYGEGFCDARNAFEEDVSVGEKADKEAVHEGLLTDDNARDLVVEGFDPLAGLDDLFGEFLRAGHRLEGKVVQTVHEACD